MTEPLALSGCKPEPLMGYLKALGVFRLVAEQADRNVKMSLPGGACRLHTYLERDELIDYFLNRYRPTPILAPWNGGSGFYGGGSAPLDTIRNSSAERLTQYRAAINTIRQFVSKDKPKDEEKQELLNRCRAELPDELVPWLDTCFALGEDGPSYFPLLGTGGNDGRLDFTNNFFQRLADVIPFEVGASPPPESPGWLASAVFADDPGLTALGKAAVGQFNPGGIGGANGVQGSFEADSQVNPWDFVLMMEGVLLFAGSIARRLGANAGSEKATFPFCVEGIVVGNGSFCEKEARAQGKEPPNNGELWLPLWFQPVSLAELTHLFAEGRAQFGRKQARNSVEFSLAVNLLGVSRGIDAFTRYGFLRRNGKAFVAAPIGRITVTLRPVARLLSDFALGEWLDKLRGSCKETDGKKDKVPARYKTALRQIDRAIYEFATRSQTDPTADRRALLEVLRAVGRAERTLANGLAFCKDKHLRPLQGLSSQWFEQADDGSPEFRLAASVAGIHAVKDTAVGPFRVHLEPVAVNRAGRFEWDGGSTSAIWSNRPLANNLAAVFCRRQMEAFRTGLAGVPLASPRHAPLADVIAFLNDEADDEKLHDLIWGLSLVESPPDQIGSEPIDGTSVPFEYGVPRLLVEPVALTANRGQWQLGGTEATTPDPDVFHILSSGRQDAIERCIDRAARRLKSDGRLVVGYRNRSQAGKSLAVVSPLHPTRLLAASFFPLSGPDLKAIAITVLYPPEIQE